MDFVLPIDIGGTVFTYHHTASGAAATASQLSGVTVAAYRPGGAELLPTQEVTPDADGRMALAVAPGLADRAGDYYRARFLYTAESAAHVRDVYFHVAPAPFDLPVHCDDLLRLEPDLASMPYSGDEKFEQFRLAARDELFYRLKAAGRRPWRLLNVDDLRPCALYLWASYVFRALSKSSADFFPRADHYRELFEHIFSRSEFLEDDDADARADEAASGPGETLISRT